MVFYVHTHTHIHARYIHIRARFLPLLHLLDNLLVRRSSWAPGISAIAARLIDILQVFPIAILGGIVLARCVRSSLQNAFYNGSECVSFLTRCLWEEMLPRTCSSALPQWRQICKSVSNSTESVSKVHQHAPLVPYYQTWHTFHKCIAY